MAFSVIVMEWFDKISEFMEGLPEWLQAHPRYGYLIVAGILLLWLVGIVCGWRWTYSRPGSWEGNFWLYITGSFASFFIIAEQKNHSKEQPLIERLQEIRDGKYPVEKTHSPTGE